MYTEGIVPLNKFFDIKDGTSVKLINEPENYRTDFFNNGTKIVFHTKLKEPVDLIHLFTRSKKELSVELPRLAKFIKKGGSFFVSWPSGKINFVSDLNEAKVRELGVQAGLTAMETASISSDWRILKFVIKDKEVI